MSSDVADLARRAREASRPLALATRATKDAALHAMADGLDRRTDEVLAANDVDVRRAEDADTPAHMVDRLRLTGERVAAMAGGLRDLARPPTRSARSSGGARWPTGSSSGRCGCRSESSG